jgi:hypothetical protein
MIKQEKAPISQEGKGRDEEYGREENEEEDDDDSYYKELAELKVNLGDDDEDEENESMMEGLGKRSLREEE